MFWPFGIDNKFYFQYLQLTNAIPREWRHILIDDTHHPLQESIPTKGLIQGSRIIPLNELVSRRIYALLIRKKNHTPTAQTTYNDMFPHLQPKNWLQIYMLPRKSTRNSYTRHFQYKILNNVLYLNVRLVHFGISETNLCSFCGSLPENPTHLFSQCHHVTQLWSEHIVKWNPWGGGHLFVPHR